MAKRFGRPRIYESVDEMESDIADYFDECQSTGRPVTIAGLAYAINMTTRSLINYESKPGFEQFFPIIKRAKQLVELATVEGGMSGDTNTAMSIFLCKANFGYKDKADDENQDINVNIIRKVKPAPTEDNG